MSLKVPYPAAGAAGTVERDRCMTELERRIVFAQRSKTRLGYDRGALLGIAEELIGRWPTVKQALERFGEAAEEATK